MNGGPASGFKTEDGMGTGKRIMFLKHYQPNAAYSPLWDVQIYDNQPSDQ